MGVGEENLASLDLEVPKELTKALEALYSTYDDVEKFISSPKTAFEGNLEFEFNGLNLQDSCVLERREKR